MATKPLKPCTVPGCPELVARGRCVRHARSYDRQVKASSPWRFVYTSPLWPGLRRTILRRDPMCRSCGERPSAEVDHVVPLASGGEAFDQDNLQGLCRPCHSRKTNREVRDRGR